MNRTTEGRSAKWLDIVSARTPGFTLNYLKAPLYAEQAGDLFEEGDGAGGERRLLGGADAAKLTARVIARSAVNAGSQAGEASSNDQAADNVMVFDAKDAFDERGFVWASNVLAALARKVAHMELWFPAPNDQDKTLEQLLQQPDAFPKLPKELTASSSWLRKRIKDLSEGESANAATLLKGVARGLDAAAQTSRDNPDCAYVYAPETAFGFTKSGAE